MNNFNSEIHHKSLLCFNLSDFYQKNDKSKLTYKFFRK